MKDNELRGVVLQKFYDLRRRGPFQWAEIGEEGNDDAFFEKVGADLFRICDQLAEHGLIEWESLPDGRGRSCGGHGQISADGIDIVEGNTRPPVSISFDNSIRVESSSHVQVGNSNIQTGDISLEKLIAAINNSRATENEKAEAKSLLTKVLENPILAAVLKTFLPTNPFAQKQP